MYILARIFSNYKHMIYFGTIVTLRAGSSPMDWVVTLGWSPAIRGERDAVRRAGIGREPGGGQS